MDPPVSLPCHHPSLRSFFSIAGLKPCAWQAYINVPLEDEAVPPTKGAADRAVLDRLALSVNPKIFASRIQFIKSLDRLKDVCPSALQSHHKI